MTNKNRTQKLAISALIAAAAGYVTGLLTAPKSGKETRKDIADASQKAKQQAEKRLKELHKELGDLIDKGKVKVDKLTTKAKGEYETSVGKAQLARRKAGELLSASHEGEADNEDLQKAIDEARKASEHLRKFMLDNDQKSAKK